MKKKPASSPARPYIVAFVIGAIMIVALLATMYAVQSSQELRSKAAGWGFGNKNTGEVIDGERGYRGGAGSDAEKLYNKLKKQCEDENRDIGYASASERKRAVQACISRKLGGNNKDLKLNNSK